MTATLAAHGKTLCRHFNFNCEHSRYCIFNKAITLIKDHVDSREFSIFKSESSLKSFIFCQVKLQVIKNVTPVQVTKNGADIHKET